jgi:hypothetical protein
MSTNPLNDIAPWPQSEDGANDETILQSLTTDAYAAYCRARMAGRRAFAGKAKNPEAVAEYAGTLHTLAGWFLSAFLLRSLRDGADVEETTQQVWRFLGDEGLDMGEFLFDWLVEHGIDPKQVEQAVTEGEVAA